MSSRCDRASHSPCACGSTGQTRRQILQQKGGPVCGWIVPNHLDKSLTIYATSGIPLGALQKKLDLQSGANGGAAGAFYWVDVPGGENVGSDLDAPECADRLATLIENTHLRYFCCWVLGLSADHGGVFSLLVETRNGRSRPTGAG